LSLRTTEAYRSANRFDTSIISVAAWLTRDTLPGSVSVWAHHCSSAVSASVMAV
jgi:hypothetical protein